MSATTDIYTHVTEKIVAMLEAGVVPWRSPILGSGPAGQPRNLHSGKTYRGVNVFLLAFTAFAHGYDSAYWLTYNQARERGGNVRKGEKSSMVVFWKTYQVADAKTKEAKTVPVLRYYHVFNARQCEGIDIPDGATFTPLDFQPIAEAEKIANSYAGGPPVEHSGTRAYYAPLTDRVTMPEKQRFVSHEEYYSTLFHELAHSTGHSSRLDRELDTQLKPFGTPDYAKEELVAEMAAAFLSARAGISPATLDNSAAYLKNWIQKLKGDHRLVVQAAGAAQKASDWILGERQPPAE
jgi:antirestriction protein ArdC